MAMASLKEDAISNSVMLVLFDAPEKALCLVISQLGAGEDARTTAGLEAGATFGLAFLFSGWRYIRAGAPFRMALLSWSFDQLEGMGAAAEEHAVRKITTERKPGCYNDLHAARIGQGQSSGSTIQPDFASAGLRG